MPPDEDDSDNLIKDLSRKLKELEYLYRRLSENKKFLRQELEKLEVAFHQG